MVLYKFFIVIIIRWRDIISVCHVRIVYGRGFIKTGGLFLRKPNLALLDFVFFGGEG